MRMRFRGCIFELGLTIHISVYSSCSMLEHLPETWHDHYWSADPTEEVKWQFPINMIMNCHFVITYCKEFMSMIPTSKWSLDHIVAELLAFDVAVMLCNPALWNWPD